MKPKLVRLDEATRATLMRSTIRRNRLTLPQQLDRASYMLVAKAIEAAGGKWNRKERCHIFPQGVRETLDITPETVEVLNVQQTYQAFYTPPAIAELMADMADLTSGDKVLEPSAGTGRLIQAMLSRGIFRSDITAVELNPKSAELLKPLCGSVHCGDFLKFRFAPQFDRVLMNPPFTGGQDLDHVLHAYAALRSGGRLITICAGGPTQREAFQNATDWTDLPQGAFASEGTNVRTAIVTFDKP